MILISALVTILGSCLSFGIDYLFVEILSAPTAEVAKADALVALQSLQPRSSNNMNIVISEKRTKQPQLLPPGGPKNVRRRSSIMITSAPASASVSVSAQLKDRRMSAMVPLMTDEDARIIPSELMMAHQNALLSFDQIMISRKGLVDQTCEVRKARKQSYVGEMRTSLVAPSVSKANGARGPGTRSLSLQSRSGDIRGVRVCEETGGNRNDNCEDEHEDDAVYSALIHEIQLERESQLMTPQELQFFDHQWGSDLSPTGVSVGAILKEELKFVKLEVAKKVKKLQAARSIHVGTASLLVSRTIPFSHDLI
jgi:hypothetical protein